MRYWRKNPLRRWRLNPWWRRNPPIKDREGNPLTERQVRQILKFMYEIQKGWHTKEWFMDLLKMGEDAQVVRYILKNVDWGFSTGRGAVSVRALKEVEEYLESLDRDRFPDVDLDLSRLQALLDTRDQFPLFIGERVSQLEGALHNLKLAERLGESRESIYRLKNRILSFQIEIDDILTSIREEAAASAAPTPEASPLLQEINACDRCSEETFDWLDSDERSDVVDIAHDLQIAELQHRLRHVVIELRDAITSNRTKTYIFDIEDDMEEIHAKIEKLRASNRYRRNSYHRYNPFY